MSVESDTNAHARSTEAREALYDRVEAEIRAEIRGSASCFAEALGGYAPTAEHDSAEWFPFDVVGLPRMRAEPIELTLRKAREKRAESAVVALFTICLGGPYMRMSETESALYGWLTDLVDKYVEGETERRVGEMER